MVSCERNAIEGKLGEGKRRYSLELVKKSDTQFHLAFFGAEFPKDPESSFYFLLFIYSMRFFAKRRQTLTATV